VPDEPPLLTMHSSGSGDINKGLTPQQLGWTSGKWLYKLGTAALSENRQQNALHSFVTALQPPI